MQRLVGGGSVPCELLSAKFPGNREKYREFCGIQALSAIQAPSQRANSIACRQIPCITEQGIFERVAGNEQGTFRTEVSVHFLHACLLRLRTRSVLIGNFAGEEDEMSDEIVSRTRYGEAFWRTHHEAWRRSELNQMG